MSSTVLLNTTPTRSKKPSYNYLVPSLLSVGIVLTSYALYRYYNSIKLSKHKKLLNNSILSLKVEDINNISKLIILKIWNYYDIDNNDYLDIHELNSLISDVLIVLSEDNVLENNVRKLLDVSKEDEIKNNILKSTFKLLMNSFNDKKKHYSIAKDLISKLDSNKDGFIDKNEFMNNFGPWLQNHMVHTLHNL